MPSFLQTNCPTFVSAACGGYNSALTTDNEPMLHNGAPVLQNIKNADVFMWCAAAPHAIIRIACTSQFLLLVQVLRGIQRVKGCWLGDYVWHNDISCYDRLD